MKIKLYTDEDGNICAGDTADRVGVKAATIKDIYKRGRNFVIWAHGVGFETTPEQLINLCATGEIYNEANE